MDESDVYTGLAAIGLSAALLAVQSFVGTLIERAHIRSLKAREAANADFSITNLDAPDIKECVRAPVVVTGEAVVSSDCFKTWLFSLRNVFGGESRSFTRLFDRARREATLRMIDEARKAGHNAVCNVRYESADIAGSAAVNDASSKRKKALKMAVCSVSGTAYTKP